MFIQVDPSDNTPVYEQITTQVKYAIATGAQRPGEPLPSVRQLAVEILVNPNTVARAYRELQREGIVCIRRGLGLFVSEEAPRICRRDRKDIVSTKIAQALREAVQAELGPEEIEKIVHRELDQALKEKSGD